MTATTAMPWHAETFRQLQTLHASARLGHAWLLAGHKDTGKLTLATAFAQYLFCTNHSEDKACGTCPDCHLFSVKSHPDFQLIQPENKLIKIEQVRDAIDFAQNMSRRGGMKIMLFEPAEAMNLSSANALLKLLEEPPQRTLLLLVSHQPGLLLPTIRSRCQLLRCGLPPVEMAARWLEAQGFAGNATLALQRAGGAPLRALVEVDTSAQTERLQVLECLQGLAGGNMQAVEAAKKCEKFDIAASIDYQLVCAADLSACAQGARSLRDPDLRVLSEQLGLPRQSAVFVRHLHRLYGELQQARKVVLASNNANVLLLLEGVFARWLQLGQRSRHQASI